MASRTRRPRSKPAHPALRIARSVVRWIVSPVLSLFYFATSGVLVMFGVACAWNGTGPGRSPYLDYPMAGVVTLVLGISVFVFPRLPRRLTGLEVVSSPHDGFVAGGGGSCGNSGGGGSC